MGKTGDHSNKKPRRRSGARKARRPAEGEMDVEALRRRLGELINDCEDEEQLRRIVEAVEKIAAEDE